MNVAGLIITKGLGAPAYRGLITTRYSLLAKIIKKIINVITGGSVPLLPGEIHNAYKVVDTPYNVIFNADNSSKDRYDHIKIKMKINKEETIKDYMVQYLSDKNFIELNDMNDKIENEMLQDKIKISDMNHKNVRIKILNKPSVAINMK